jgi:hypothetical protein
MTPTNSNYLTRRPTHFDNQAETFNSEKDQSPANKPSISFYLIQTPISMASNFLNSYTAGLANKVIQSVHFFFSVTTTFWQFFANIYWATNAAHLEGEINGKIQEMFKELFTIGADTESIENAWTQLQDIETPLDRLGVAIIFYELAQINPSFRMNRETLQSVWADMQAVKNPEDRLEMQEFLLEVLAANEEKKMTRTYRLEERREKIKQANEALQMNPPKISYRASRVKKSVRFTDKREVVTFKMDKNDLLRNGKVTGRFKETVPGKTRELAAYDSYIDTYDNKPQKHQDKFKKKHH